MGVIGLGREVFRSRAFGLRNGFDRRLVLLRGYRNSLVSRCGSTARFTRIGSPRDDRARWLRGNGQRRRNLGRRSLAVLRGDVVNSGERQQ